MATPQNQDKAIQKISSYMRSDMVKQRFSETIGNGNSGAYISSVLLAVAENEALQKCTLESIYTSAMRAASLRLSVDPSTGQAYLVPYGARATLIVGYKGLQDMAVRTGKYRYINVTPIYEGEKVEENRISGFHSISGGKESKTIIGWLAAFEMYAGFAHTMYMTVEEIHEHAQKYSKSYENPKGGWKTDTHAMERKTVLRLLLRKWGYLDPADATVLEEIENDSPPIDVDAIDPAYLPDSQEYTKTEDELMKELGY